MYEQRNAAQVFGGAETTAAIQSLLIIKSDQLAGLMKGSRLKAISPQLFEFMFLRHSSPLNRQCLVSDLPTANWVTSRSRDQLVLNI